MTRLILLLLLCSASRVWAAACAESPTGQSNCEIFSARDQNALPTPLPNYLKLLDNNATAAVAPTPAAGECVLGDEDASSTDDFALRCATTLGLKRVVLDAGTTAAGTAPLKFTAGDLLTAVEAGAMEFYNNALWFTNLAVRRTVVQAQEVLISDVTVGNTVTETTVYTVPHGANYLKVGKQEDIVLVGAITSNSGAGSNTLTIRVKYAGSTLGSWVVPEAARTAVGWGMHVMTTVRAVGAGTTSIQLHADFDVNGTALDNVVNVLSTGHDSTTAQSTTVTFEWSDADAGNTASVLQGRTASYDDN